MRPRNVVLQGEALSVLRTLPAGSVDCVVTSPPYLGVRDYGVDGQLGMEASVDEWVENLRAVASEVTRVLAPWGAFWLNVADAYARRQSDGALPKSLLLGPERLGRALLDDGWIVRNRLAWTKPNPLPASVADRLTPSWEFVYFLVRQRFYFFDLDAIRVPLLRPAAPARKRGAENCEQQGRLGNRRAGLARMKEQGMAGHPLGKNPGDAWHIPGARTRGHSATFPAELIRRPLLATCPEKVCLGCGKPWERAKHPVRFVRGEPRPRALVPCGCGVATRPGLVLDPFMGSGTVAVVAERHGRDWLGIELNPEYIALTQQRLARKA